MGGLADLLRPAPLEHDEPGPATLMVGTIIDTAPLRVVIPALDNGRDAITAFGTCPDATAGDEVRVMLDEYGTLVVVAWEAA